MKMSCHWCLSIGGRFASRASVYPSVKCIRWARFSLALRMFTEHLLCAGLGAEAKTCFRDLTGPWESLD